MDENDIGGAGRECNSVLVWGDLQVAEPVENGIAVHLGLHQSLLDVLQGGRSGEYCGLLVLRSNSDADARRWRINLAGEV